MQYVLVKRKIDGPSVPELGMPTAVTFDSVRVPLVRPSTGPNALAAYQLERVSAAGGPWVVIAYGADIFGNPPAQYVDGGRQANTQYYYRCRAIDVAGRVSAYCAVVVVTTPSGAASEVPAFNTTTPNKVVNPALTPNGTTVFRTIQAAVDTITLNDVIGVAPGTYNETVLVTRSGTAAAPVYIQALDPNNKPVIDGQMTLPVGWNESGFKAGSSNLVSIAASHIVWDSIDVVNSRIQGMNVGPANNNGYFLQQWEIGTWFENVKVLRSRIEKCNNRGFQPLNTDGMTFGGGLIRRRVRGRHDPRDLPGQRRVVELDDGERQGLDGSVPGLRQERADPRVHDRAGAGRGHPRRPAHQLRRRRVRAVREPDGAQLPGV